MTKPNIVYHPGIQLRDELDARSKKCKCCGLTKKYTHVEFANDSGMPSSQVSLIMQGHRDITPLMARRIAKALGTSSVMWVQLQMEYDLWLLERKEK